MEKESGGLQYMGPQRAGHDSAPSRCLSNIQLIPEDVSHVKDMNSITGWRMELNEFEGRASAKALGSQDLGMFKLAGN